MTSPRTGRLGPYELLSPLGRGGMGEVYRARDGRLGREVAIKVLLPELVQDPDRLRRFELEAKAIAATAHPNLLQIFDVGTEGSSPYLVMELLEGQTLRERMTQRPMPPRVVVHLGIQIARGLAAAHGKGIVHRDLKPENVFLTRDEQVKLLDFGLAKLQQPSSDDTLTVPGHGELATRPGLVVGTVGYMSPEQVTGKPLDARSDLFAVGVMLWEMLSGLRPFQGESLVETMHAILKEEPREFPARCQVPPALERVILRCLAKEPVARFQTAQDLAFALEGLDLASETRLRLPWRLPALSWRFLVWPVLLAALGLAYGLGRRGDATQVPTLRRLTYHRGVLHGARFTPDGQSVLLTRGPAGQAPSLWLSRVDGVGTHPVEAPGGSQILAVSPSGDVALRLPGERERFGTLSRLTPGGGAPRPLAESVALADWTPDGRELAALRIDDQGRNRIEFPLGRPVYPVPATHLVESLRVSPDGERVAFLEHMGLGKGAVCTLDRRGQRRVVLPEKATSLLWAPSGRELLVVAQLGEDRHEVRAVTLAGKTRLLYAAQGPVELMDVDRKGRILLAASHTRTALALKRDGQSEDLDLSWLETSSLADLSRDGLGVLFMELREGRGPGGVYYRRVGERDATRLGDGDPLVLSPDGRWALAKFVGQPVDFQLLPVGAGDTRRLSSHGLHAEWALFAGPDRLVLGGAPTSSDTFRAYVLDLKRDTLSPLPVAVPQAAYPVVAPDGQRLALGPVGEELLVVDLDRAQVRRVPRFGSSTIPLQWASTGDAVYTVDSFRRVPATIRRFDLRTGASAVVTTLRPAGDVQRLRYAAITPDGRTVAYSYDQVLSSDLFLLEGWR